MPTPDKLTTDAAVAVLIAPGLEEVEALAVVDVLYRAGIRADLVSITDSLQVVSSHKIVVTCDLLLADIDLASYELVMLPGGIPGRSNLRANAAVVAEVERRRDEGLPIAAICAAPSILGEFGVLEGKHATANPAYMTAIAEAGAVALEAPVVVDGNIFTSRGMATAVDLGVEIVRAMVGDDAVAAVKKGVVYQD